MATALEARASILSETEEQFKEENWTLSSRLKELEDKMAKSTEETRKVTTETAKLLDDQDSHMQLIDDLKLKEATSKKQLDLITSKYESELSNTQRSLDESQEQKVQLESNLHETRQELQQALAAISALKAASQISNENSATNKLNADYFTTDDSDFETPDNTPPQSPMKAGAGSSNIAGRELETETLKSSLQHAHRMINIQQKALAKEKAEKLELRRQLEDKLSGTATSNASSGAGNGSGNAITARRSKVFRRGVASGAASTSSGSSGNNQSRRQTRHIPQDSVSSESNYESAFESAREDLTSERDTGTELESAFESAVENPAFESAFDTNDDQDTETEAGGTYGHAGTAGGYSSSSDEEDGAFAHQRSLAAEFMTLDDLEQHAKTHGMKLVSIEDEHHVVTDANSIITAAQKYNLVALPIEDHTRLVKETTRQLSPEEVQLKAKDVDMVAIPSQEYFQLMRATNSPSPETLNEQARKHDMVVVQESVYRHLQQLANNPSENDLKTWAEPLGFSLIDGQELLSLKKRVRSPDLNEVESHARRHKKSLVDPEEYNQLKNPSPEAIEESAKAHKLAVVDIAELEKLRAAPTVDSIKELALSNGLTAVETAKYEEYTNPSLEKIEALANSHGRFVVTGQDHRKLSLPLEQLADEQGLKVLDKKEYAQLVSRGQPDKAEMIRLATQHGLTVVEVQALEELHRKAERPTVADVTTWGHKLNLAVVPIDEYETPTPEQLASRAANINYEVLPRDEVEELKRIASNPTIEELRALSEQSGLACVPKDVYEDFERTATAPQEPFIRHHAKKMDLEVMTVAEAESLRKSHESMTPAQIEEWAKKLNMVVLTQEAYDQGFQGSGVAGGLVAGAGAGAGESTEKPVERAPEKISYNSSVAAKRDHFEGIIKQSGNSKQDKQKRDKVVESMRSLGYVPVSTEEYKRLISNQEVYEPSKGEVIRLAKTFGLTTMPIESYQKLIKRGHVRDPSFSDIDESSKDGGSGAKQASRMPSSTSTSSIVTLDDPSSLDMKAVPAEYLASLRRIVESPTKEDLQDQASKMGLVVLAEEEAAELRKQAEIAASTATGVAPVPKVKNPAALVAEESLEHKAAAKGLCLISQEELDKLNRPIADVASEHGLAVVSADELKSLTLPLEEQAAAVGMALIAVDEVDQLRVPLEEQAKSKGLRVLSDSEYNELIVPFEERAKSKGLRVLSDSEYNQLNVPFEEQAKSKGLHVVSETDFNRLNSPLEDQARAKGLELVAKTDLDELSKPLESRAKSLGLELVSVVELEELRLPLEDQLSKKGLCAIELEDANKLKQSVEDRAAAQGLAVLPVAELQLLQMPLEKRAASQDLSLVPVSELELLRQPLEVRAASQGKALVSTNDAKLLTLPLEERARSQGLAVISETELQQLRQPLEKLAAGHGMAVVPAAELDTLRQPIDKRAARQGLALIAVSELTRLQTGQVNAQNIDAKAAQYGMIAVPRAEFNSLKNPSLARLREVAATLGFVLVPESLANAATATTTATSTATATGTAATGLIITPQASLEPKLKNSPGSPVTVVQHREVQPEIAHAASAVAIDEFFDAADTVSLASSLVHPASRTTTRDGGASLAQHPVATASTSASANHVNQLNQQRHARKASASSLASSIVTAHYLNTSQSTIYSQSSLTGRNMIPYVTQIVIGEYLYKYTRRVGISGISDNRHERYFWVHPYTLTMYWSKSSPVNGARPGNAKGVAILGVESVVDRNPLPPGLYHKSILVHTSERDIKITCPTRERHNVWYNSMRYLINRSDDDLVFDDEEATGTEYTTDKRLDAERASTRHPSSNSNKAMSIRRSLAPEMNTRYSRQPSSSSFRSTR